MIRRAGEIRTAMPSTLGEDADVFAFVSDRPTPSPRRGVSTEIEGHVTRANPTDPLDAGNHHVRQDARRGRFAFAAREMSRLVV